MALFIEADLAVYAHEIGVLEGDDDGVGIGAAGLFDGRLQDVNGHVARGGPVSFRLQPPFLLIGIGEFHGPGGDLRRRVAAVHQVDDQEFPLPFGGLPEARLFRGVHEPHGEGLHLHRAPLLEQDRALGHVHPQEEDVGFFAGGIVQSDGIVRGPRGIDLHVQHFPSLVGQHFLHDLAALPGVLDVLHHDVYLVETMAFLDVAEERDELVGHHAHVAGDPEAVFIFFVVFLHLLVIRGGQHTRGQDAHLLVFVQEVHRRKGRLGTDRASDDEVRFLFEDELFDGKQRFADGHARFQVPRVDDLGVERPLLPAHIDASGGVNFLDRQLDAALRIPAVEKCRRKGGADDNRLLGRCRDARNPSHAKHEKQYGCRTYKGFSFHESTPLDDFKLLK
jgi:hypothetical protein